MPNLDLDVNLANYTETETLKLTPNGVRLLLRSFEDNDCESWEYSLVQQLKTSLKQPQYS